MLRTEDPIEVAKGDWQLRVWEDERLAVRVYGKTAEECLVTLCRITRPGDLPPMIGGCMYCGWQERFHDAEKWRTETFNHSATCSKHPRKIAEDRVKELGELLTQCLPVLRYASYHCSTEALAMVKDVERVLNLPSTTGEKKE